eukprot:3858223-Rhodomonas_salina.1
MAHTFAVHIIYNNAPRPTHSTSMLVIDLTVDDYPAGGGDDPAHATGVASDVQLISSDDEPEETASSTDAHRPLPRSRKQRESFKPGDHRPSWQVSLDTRTKKVKNAVYVRMTEDGKGLGLFAKQDLQRGDNVARVVGPLIDTDTMLTLPRREREYVVSLNGHKYINAYAQPIDDPAKAAHLVNHSSKPNCQFKTTSAHCLLVVSDKVVKKGDELLVRYDPEYIRTHMPEHSGK